MKYHTHLLNLSGDGAGSWTLTQLNTGTQEEWMGVDKEIAALESELEGVEKWEERVKELTALLSVQDLPEGVDSE
jgi:ATP-binding cassette subfamily D (ALD) long-chain fatty acid import protein